ncbi:MAG: 4-(cytidine 5'-diphospho)-2-C-methyl-D-erythritol kinase [Pseudomonadota bacterium]
MDTLKLPSPAKLNRFLHITGQRDDGYHTLQTAFQFIDLCDDMQFQRVQGNDITLHCDHPQLSRESTENNLVHKAAVLMQEKAQVRHGTPCGVDISLEKRIPLGGGLGGGSSNAATTLLALNTLWQVNLSYKELASVSIKLGADVPIFTHGRNAWAEGIGEQFSDMSLNTPWFLIIHPDCHVSTGEIFSNSRLTRDSEIMTIADFTEQGTRNDFESLVRELYPEVDNALIWLEQFANARLTGSGSCLFASMQSRAHAEQTKQLLPNHLRAYVAKGLQTSPTHSALLDALSNTL